MGICIYYFSIILNDLFASDETIQNTITNKYIWLVSKTSPYYPSIWIQQLIVNTLISLKSSKHIASIKSSTNYKKIFEV